MCSLAQPYHLRGHSETDSSHGAYGFKNRSWCKSHAADVSADVGLRGIFLQIFTPANNGRVAVLRTTATGVDDFNQTAR